MFTEEELKVFKAVMNNPIKFAEWQGKTAWYLKKTGNVDRLKGTTEMDNGYRIKFKFEIEAVKEEN